MKRWHMLAALVTGIAVLAGIGATARVADAAPSANAPIKVGIVYSRTGAFAAYGAEYLSGLRLGLDYATGGKGPSTGARSSSRSSTTGPTRPRPCPGQRI